MTLLALRLAIIGALLLLLQPVLSKNISEVPLTNTNVSTSGLCMDLITKILS